MKKYLYILFAVAIFAGCSKDDEGGDGGKFYVRVPGFVKCTTPIHVDLSVPCDAIPTVTFSTENDGLGVVSPVEAPVFDTDYVYAGEPVKNVQFANGQASVSFWYIPLTAGSHAVDFTATYTLNGIAKTITTRSVLSVSDAANGGFYPEVTSDGYYYFSFRNALKQSNGCDIYVAFESLNGKNDPALFDIVLTQEGKYVEIGQKTFYPIETETWNEKVQRWLGGDYLIIQEISNSVSLKLIFRDSYNRCRNVTVEADHEKVISSTADDYYLWPRQ